MKRVSTSRVMLALFAWVFSCGAVPAPAGAMRTARRNHAAVTLADGRVLVVGGTSLASSGALASAEVYDPATGRWTAVADMAEARNEPAAVLLPDGRVLVAGGSDVDRRPVRSAELFDPETGRWTRTGAPASTRGGARTGVVLASGKVLFVSGLQAELYDPASGQWTKAGPVGGAAGTHRSGHTVTRLTDGRVLVVGGTTSRAAATAELYDPASGRWSLAEGPVCGAGADGCGGTLECGPEDCGVERALFDPELRAPRCDGVEQGCASGSLLTGRGRLGPEPNAPNALWGSCGDGEGGKHERDEALEGLRVVTVEGGTLAAGKTVRVEATVWAYEDPGENRLDLYFTADARNPAWTYLATLTPGRPGMQVLSATFVLPVGTLQAVRGVFRYAGSAEPCPGGVFDDVDDLVFATR